jgi:hypothetical protein
MQKVSRRAGSVVTQLEVRTEEDWLREIEKIHKSIRWPIAKIVWWDFFSYRPCTNRAKGFDIYLNVDLEQYPPNKLAIHLEKVGYSREMAIARVSGKGGLMRANKV